VQGRYKMLASFTNAAIVNRFFANAIEIRALNYTTHDVQRCDMRSLQSTANVTSAGNNNNNVGLNGINITSNVYDNTQVLNNSIFNHFSGINVFCNLGGTTATSFGNIAIRNNTIKNINVTTNPTAFVASAINVGMTLGSGASVPLPVKSVNIDNNVMCNVPTSAGVGVYEGINISGFSLSNVSATVTNNNITLVADPNATSANITHSGIRSSNNGFSTISHVVSGNTVRGINTTGTNPNSRVVNFELTSLSNSFVECNRSVTGYTGFKFIGRNLGTSWNRNIMDDAGSSHFYNFHLSNSSIGAQGSTTTSMDNRYGTVTGFHTNVTGLPTALLGSPFFVRNLAPFVPTNNSILPIGATYTAVGAVTPIATTVATNNCTPLPPAAIVQSVPTPSSIAQMMDIANSQVNYGVDSPLHKWLAQYVLYKTLANDIASQNANATLSNYYINGATTTIRNLVAIEDYLTQGNTVTANALLGTIIPTNVPEQNYKSFYLAYIAYINNTMTLTDMETFKNMALGCPMQNGLIVFNARTMYNMLNPAQFTMYANNCAGVSNKKEDYTEEMQLNTNGYVVYPNPTNNGFFISQGSKLNADLKVELLDITGKKVFSQECIYTGKDCYFNASISSGIYIVRILNKNTNEVSNIKLQIN
jgi:Secretion system C-terminal sorting domain